MIWKMGVTEIYFNTDFNEESFTDSKKNCMILASLIKRKVQRMQLDEFVFTETSSHYKLSKPLSFVVCLSHFFAL